MGMKILKHLTLFVLMKQNGTNNCGEVESSKTHSDMSQIGVEIRGNSTRKIERRSIQVFAYCHWSQNVCGLLAVNMFFALATTKLQFKFRYAGQGKRFWSGIFKLQGVLNLVNYDCTWTITFQIHFQCLGLVLQQPPVSHPISLWQ